MKTLHALSFFLRDDTGELSCMRLLSLLVVCAVLGVWIWANLSAGRYVPLGAAEAGVISAVAGGKAAQGYFEYGSGDGAGGRHS